MKNSILHIFQKNSDKFNLNENQTNQIETQRLCSELDSALKEKKGDSTSSLSGSLSEKEKEKETEKEPGKEQVKEQEKKQEQEKEQVKAP